MLMNEAEPFGNLITALTHVPMLAHTYTPIQLSALFHWALCN